LPAVLALAEFASGRRYRSLVARARTSSITLAAYGACVGIEPLLRAALGFARATPAPGRSATEAAALALEKLGVLALPVNPASASFAAYLLAAAVLVVALEPAFSAARSAPRLWSLILAAGATLVLAASFRGGGVRVQPGDFTHAEVLAPGLFTVCAALALASTALGGLRRALVPAILATGLAAIAHEHASAWSASVAAFDGARRDVATALAQEPRPAAVILLDVPELVRGFAPLDRTRSQAFLAAPEFAARDAAELEAARARAQPAPFVAAATRGALVQFSRTLRFAELRAAGLAVARDVEHGARREVLRLPEPAPTTGTRRWYADNSSTAIDWEALTLRSVSARGPRDTELEKVPVLGWNASGVKEGRTPGIWIELAGEPQARFDVAGSVEWLCAGRVQLAWPEGGWANLSGADAQDELPKFEPPARPTADGDDWRLPELDAPLAAAAEATLGRRGESGTTSLSSCNLETLEQLRFELLTELPRDAGSVADLVARGAGRAASAWTARGEPFAWSIEYAAHGVVLVRDDGLVKPEAESR